MGRAESTAKPAGWVGNARRACKPDFVQGFRPWMTIPLPTVLPRRSSCQPGPLGRWRPCGRYPRPFDHGPAPARGPYLALLRVGLAVPVLLPVPRWALTPPFHHHPCEQGQSLLCGAFPGVAPAGGYPAPLPTGVRTFLGSCDPRSSSPPRGVAVRPCPASGQPPMHKAPPPTPGRCHPLDRAPKAESAAGTRQAGSQARRRHSQRCADRR